MTQVLFSGLYYLSFLLWWPNGLQFEGTLHSGAVMAAGAEHKAARFIDLLPGRRDEYRWSAQFSLLTQPWTPVHEIILVTFRDRLPFLVKPFWKQLTEAARVLFAW